MSFLWSKLVWHALDSILLILETTRLPQKNGTAANLLIRYVDNFNFLVIFVLSIIWFQLNCACREFSRDIKLLEQRTRTCNIYSKFTCLGVEAFRSIPVKDNVSTFLFRLESYGLVSLGDCSLKKNGTKLPLTRCVQSVLLHHAV